MIVRGSREWMTAEWPPPPMRVRHADEAEQRKELLARERLLGDDERERRDQHSRPGRDADAGLLRQPGRVPPGQVDPDASLGVELLARRRRLFG
jgi:hypothetical protein